MRTRLLLAAVIDAVALAALVPRPHRLIWAARHLATDPDTALAALARALGFATAAWVGLGLLLVVAAELPGRAGVLAGRAQTVVLPAAARRLVAGAVGVGLVVTPAVASARSVPTAPPAPGWPVATQTSVPAPTTSAAPPGTNRPASAPGTAPAPAPGWPAGSTAPAPARPADRAAVVVRPGDSLWSIAAGRLDGPATDARVAVAWPAWWTANRAVIGTDPDLIRPGQALTPPTARHSRPGQVATRATAAPTPDRTPRGTS